MSLNRDGADGSNEGQMACGRAKSSHQKEDQSDDELDEYDLDNYDEEEYTGKNLNVR